MPQTDNGTIPVQETEEEEIQQVSEENEQEPVEEEPLKVMVTTPLVDKDINFVGKQAEEVKVTIPEQNDGYLYSIISPDLNTSVDVRIFVNSDQYCDGSACRTLFFPL